MTEQDPDVAAALAEVARLSAEAQELAQTAGTDLVPLGAAANAPELVKAQMIAVRSNATQKAAELALAQKTARAAIEAQRRRLDAQLAEMAAALAPLQKQVARMQEGIWTINLYLGTGEEIVQLASGEPAPADTPIVVRQMVLAADEETAIAAEDGGIDFASIREFDQWLVTDPAHLNQIVPEARGVVAVMPRRTDRDYGDPWLNAQRNAENHKTFFVIRNGENVYILVVDFSVGPRLVPGRDEFTQFFTRRTYNWQTRQDEYVNIEPGTAEWTRAEEAAGARERHYMRVALILQGLLDRTSVFQPLPEEGLSLLHPAAYDSGRVVLLADEENVLTSGRQPFAQWLAEKNAQLRVGMRVVGNFRSEAWKEANVVWGYSSGPEYGRHARLRPERVESTPTTGAIYTLEKAEGDGLVFYFARTDKVYRRGVEVPGKPGYVYRHPQPVEPSRRAACVIERTDTFVLSPDLVTIEECEAYLNARTERHAYLEMFPVLKAIIAAKRDEAEAEAPMRTLLAGQIAQVYGVDLAEAEDALDELIEWWKTANRWHRALVFPDDPKTEARAVRAVVREFGARRVEVDADVEARAVEALRRDYPGLIVVARKRDGSWLGYEPMPRAYSGQPTLVYLREHTWTKTLAGHAERDWIVPTLVSIARWRVLWAGSAWTGRTHAVNVSDWLTDPEIEALGERAKGAAVSKFEDHKRWVWDSREWLPDPIKGRLAVVALPRNEGPGEPTRRIEVYWTEQDWTPGEGGRRTLAVRRYVLDWRRTTGGAIQTADDHLDDATWSAEAAPWESRTVLWVDDDAVAILRDRRRQQEEHNERLAHFWGVARTAYDSLERQWYAAELAARRAKFVESYGDDEALWEDHLRQRPISHGSRDRYGMDKVRNWLADLAARGVNLDGLTLRQAAALVDRDATVWPELADYVIRLNDDGESE